MKKIWVSCMVMGWVMMSSAPFAWAQNQTTTSSTTTTNGGAPSATNIDALTKTLEAATTTTTTTTQSTTPAATPATAPVSNQPTSPQNAMAAAAGNPTQTTAPVQKSPTVLSQDELQNRAFENAVGTAFPLTPEQIQQVLKRMSESQEAARAPPEPDPTPVVKIEDIPLDPGVSPPVIHVAIGYVTTVNILDITGQPWQIQDVVVGGNFQVTGPNDAQVLRIIPQTRFGRGNLSVRLVGLSTPITFRVESGGKEVYYRYDARITQSGPDAKQPLIDHGFTGQAGDPTLMSMLSGIAPKEAKRLDLTGVDNRTRAWKMNDMVYLRTPLTLLSPGWDSSVRSADGTSVYVLPETPVLMLSDNGQMVRAGINIPPEDPFHSSDLKDGKVTVPVDEPAPAKPATAATANAAAPTTATTGAVPADNPNAAAPPTALQISQAASATAATMLPPGTTPATIPPTTSTSNTGTNGTSGSVRKIGNMTIYTNGSSPTPTTNNLPINVNIGGGNGS